MIRNNQDKTKSYSSSSLFISFPLGTFSLSFNNIIPIDDDDDDAGDDNTGNDKS